MCGGRRDLESRYGNIYTANWKGNHLRQRNLLYYSTLWVFFAGISNGFILNRDEPRIHILKDFFYRVYRLKLYRLINTHVRDYKSWAIYNIGSCYGFRSNNFCFCSISNFARGLYRFLYRRMFTFHQRLMLICWARQISNSERPWKPQQYRRFICWRNSIPRNRLWTAA